MTPAGWYRDPYGNPGLLRWWDGREWTETTRPGDEEVASDAGAPQTSAPDAGSASAGGAAAEPAPGAADDAPGTGRPGTFSGAQTQAWSPSEPAAPGWAPAGAAAPGGEVWPPPGAQPPGSAWPASQEPSWAPPGQPGWGGSPGAWGAAQPPAGGGHRTRTALLIGGGVTAVIAVIVVIALVASGAFGGGDGGGGGGDKNARSTVTSTITDSQAGLSYPALAGWKTENAQAGGNLARLGFSQGESIPVMENYENGQPYIASAYSGTVTDTTSGTLESKAKALFAALEPVAYPSHTRNELSSVSHPVDGHDGWLLKVRLDFPQAKSSGWNFRSETAAVVIIDRGGGRPPAEFYVSIPDSHKNLGDLDLLLTSLKVS